MVCAGYVICLTRLKPPAGASEASSLVVSVPQSVFSLMVAIGPTLVPRFASNSFMNSKKLRTNRSSCAVVRKNHLKPRCVSEADDDSAFRNGIL